MLIDFLRVSGFRGIENIEISLPKIAVLIGPNNSGKTSLIKALQLSIGDYSRSLSEEDFYIDKFDNRAAEIIIDIRIVFINNEDKRVAEFSDEWVEVFGDRIQAEADGKQFIAIRTRSRANLIKGGFDTERFSLDSWLDFDVWRTKKIKEQKMPLRMTYIPYVAIDAQRDIHQELKEKSSFVGRILSSIEYDKKDTDLLEELIKEVNEEAVGKSEQLKSLKSHLENLSKSVGSAGIAEVTPFPKKVRDLSKHFSIHFGETAASSFSMEYHGMGTRSWASMLTVRSFIELLIEKHLEQSEPFFPVLAAEEPEAHLHPNAQKTLYKQLAETKGQLILSTHSPYLAAMANVNQLRSLSKKPEGLVLGKMDVELIPEDLRRFEREILNTRGEILFSRAIVLCEGETEEQALPVLFKKFFGCEPFELGVNFVGVGGSEKKYYPFFNFSKNFSVPVFVFSDGEEKTLKGLKKNYEKVFGVTDLEGCPNITYLPDTDFEGYLLNSGYMGVVEDAIREIDGPNSIQEYIKKRHGTKGSNEKTEQPPCVLCKQHIYDGVARDYIGLGYTSALLDILDSKKTKYAPVIAQKLCDLPLVNFPPKIVELFSNIKNEALS
jgi:putative ATP-dependent endonuclease of OLD family